MPHIRTSIVLSLLAGTISVARADSVTITASADNTLYQTADGSISNGLGTAMFAGTNSGFPPTIRRCVFLFDIASAVPAGKQITGATLMLSQNGSNADTQSCSLHRLLASWGEGNSTASGGQGGGTVAATNDATWLHRFRSADLWTTAGGDFVTSATAVSEVSGAGTYMWSSTQLIADVQLMLDSPAQNNGWIVRGNESTPQTTKRFSTREDPDSVVRPTLFIEFAGNCPGDLNGDNQVDDTDFVLFAASYDLLDCSDPAMPAGCPSDLNGDGTVEDSDFVIFVGAYNDLICP